MTELFDENRESVVSETETDDLRTRIAATIMQSCHGVYIDDAANAADAMIQELNLAAACQSGCVWQIPDRVEDMTEAQREMLNRTADE